MTMHARVHAVLSILALLTIAPHPARAIEAPEISLKGGLSLANMSLSNDLGTHLQWRTGLAAGISVALPISESFSIQPELLYVVKGFSYGESEGRDMAGNPTGTFESLRAVDYLEVPVLLGQRWGGGSVTLRFTEGPAFAFEVRERFVTTGSSKTSIRTSDLSNFDIGAVIGAGVELGRGTNRLSIEGRYTLGLRDLSSGSIDANRAWVLMTGIVYRLHRNC